ncbi:MAG: DUF1638 domain-containing protein [Spirochaetales bacterium]|nr:DUF1638 domain-containing protein [Spirochaetales bacterium]
MSGVEVSFEELAVVACGTMGMELNALKQSGFLNARKLLFTKPGRHEVPRELETQLVERIRSARRYADKVIVVYGGKFCYINANDPYRTIDGIIAEQGPGIVRINATHCVDMLADAAERERISAGGKVFWLTPGWVVYRDNVFEDWDQGKANETFPQNSGGAILLDAVGFWEEFSASHPEKILDFSDWMAIPIHPHPVSLGRFKSLLTESARQLLGTAAA